MRVIPQTPLEWVLLVVAAATGVIIAVALQDFFIDSRHNPRIRALQDVGVAFAVIHFFGLTMVGSAGPRWTAVAIAMYVAATLLFLSALESARRMQLPRTLVEDTMPKSLITTGPFALIRHPFYVAYSLAWLAAPVATHGPFITLTGLMAVVVYAIAARREERQLEAQFGEVFRVYRSRAGLIAPSIPALVRSFR